MLIWLILFFNLPQVVLNCYLLCFEEMTCCVVDTSNTRHIYKVLKHLKVKYTITLENFLNKFSHTQIKEIKDILKKVTPS